MGFQIQNKNEAIDIADLDKEAAIFWNKKVDIKYYASPQNAIGNWFDVIGFAIHSHKCDNWNRLKELMKGDMAQTCNNGRDFDDCLMALQPYFELIDHWKSLDYMPKWVE